MNCPESLFKTLKMGDWSSDSALLELAYEALSQADSADYIKVHFPAVADLLMESWSELESWFEHMSPVQSLWDIWDPEDEDWEHQFPMPKDAFKNIEEIKTAIIDALIKNEASEIVVLCRQIQCGQESAFFIFTGLDGWVLGHADSVLVVGALSELRVVDGFYPLEVAQKRGYTGTDSE